MIAIIGAMSEEVSALLPYFSELRKDMFQHRELYLNDEIVIAKSGVGKVEAAYTTSMLLSSFDIDLVINIGSAGGLKNNQKVGDVVVANELRYHDYILDITKERFGASDRVFFPNSEEVETIKFVLQKLDVPFHVGLGVSGDQFVSTKAQVDFITNYFPRALFCEMEATAVAHVCNLKKTNFVIIRGLSDIAITKGNELEFEEYLKLAAAQSAKICYEFIVARRG